MAAKRVFEGLTVVTIGFILLGNTMGVLPWSVWWNILMLWPLLLVSAGVDILGRAVNSSALRVLASLVVIGGLVFAVLAATGTLAVPGFGVGSGRGQAFTESRPAASATAGEAEIDIAAARASLKAGDELVTVAGRTPFGAPRITTDTQGGVAKVDVGMDERFAFPRPQADSYMDVTLDRGMTWQRVKLDAGVSDLDLDVSDLDIRKLDVNVGMSSVKLTFGESAGGSSAELSGGMSSFTVRVPRSLGVLLEAENGLGSVKVPDGWERVADDGPFQGTWRSDGYDAATSKLRLVVKTGMSSVDVVRY